MGRDYLGVDVNIAARLAEAAKPGELLVSNHTLEKLEPSAASAKRRRFSAKGTPAELTAYALTRDPAWQRDAPPLSGLLDLLLTVHE